MIHAMGAMHAALRAKLRRQEAQNRSATKEGVTKPKGPPEEKLQRSKN